VAGRGVDARIVIGAVEQTSPLGSAYDVLFRVKLLLRAMAIAGVQQLPSAKDLAEEADGDSTNHRVCPWDVVFRIECRIERCMRDVPYEQARAWLLRQFDAEQRYWIDKIRNSKTVTIGQVLQQSLIERESVWTQPCVASPVRDRPVREAEPPPRRKQEREHKAEFNPANFCTAFNRGSCSYGDKCRFLHRCSRITGEQESGAPHYCNARHAEKDHDSLSGKGKKGAGKGGKLKLKRRGARGSKRGGGGKR
jgi:hypothetical protein